MPEKEPRLLLTTSPFLKHQEDAAFIMWQVNLALIPVLVAATYFFGVSALLISACCVAGAVIPEWLLNRSRNTLSDGTAVITGLLVALTLPPSVALWIAFVGGFMAITLGKLLFGGIGYNVFNPALVGRAFLQAAFPEAMTTWTPGREAGGFLTTQGDLFAIPFAHPQVAAVTSATPLAQMKFDAVPTPVPDLLLGLTTGSLGETSSVLILLCGSYLAFRRVLNWRIPVSIFGSVFVFAGIMHLIDPARFAAPLFHLFSGGLVLGAVFMATDPVSSPITQRGCWVFGIGIGAIVIVIRVFGGLPEGVMYAILLMNALTPLINRVTQPRVYGVSRKGLFR